MALRRSASSLVCWTLGTLVEIRKVHINTNLLRQAIAFFES
jgi:hypothetical protein